jgi:F-box domain
LLQYIIYLFKHQMDIFEQIKFPLDIWYLILGRLDFLSQIRLRQVCKYFYHYLEVYDFYHIPDKLKNRLSDEILKNYCFIRSLDTSDNPKITKINHMTNLKKLDASWDCGIDDQRIQNLNLVELNASNNPKIININHLTNLKKLDASWGCGIDDQGIQNLNLVELDACNNAKITNINHMTNLKKLNAGWNCGIDDQGIQNLNLIKLRARFNPKITKKLIK